MAWNKLIDWVDHRLPVKQFWHKHMSGYYAPKNFNFWYYFGALALLVLVIQLVSGIWLAMHYVPSAQEAFNSVEYIMRDVPYGWLLRYLHSTGASAFFLVVYLHIMRALLYGSFRAPRELVWLLGMSIFVTLMAEAFFGYLLPWGQMSFWGAQVITSLFGAVPGIGPGLMIWLRGDYNVSGETLNRFFVLHVVVMPLILIGLVVLHILALHHVGSHNPDGISIKKHLDARGIPLDGIAFHPYYTVKDLFIMSVFLLLYAGVVFFAPEGGGLILEAPNFEPANPLKTPPHIAPVWYMTPFYAILRAIPNKLVGITLMGGAILIPFFLPWLDKSPVASIRYRAYSYPVALSLWVISFLGLGYLGVQVPTPRLTTLAQIFTVGYFSFFLLMPFYTRWDKSYRPEPDRIRLP